MYTKSCTEKAVILSISPMVSAWLIVIDNRVDRSGCPGIETRLPLLFNYGLSEGRITPERFVDLVSAAPAKLVIFAPRHFLNVRTDALMLVVWIISSKRCPLAWPFWRWSCHLVSACFFRLSFLQFLIINFRRHIAGILKIKWYLSASPMIIYTMVLIVGQYGSFKQMLTKGQTLRMRAWCSTTGPVTLSFEAKLSGLKESFAARRKMESTWNDRRVSLPCRLLNPSRMINEESLLGCMTTMGSKEYKYLYYWIMHQAVGAPPT